MTNHKKLSPRSKMLLKTMELAIMRDYVKKLEKEVNKLEKNYNLPNESI